MEVIEWISDIAKEIVGVLRNYFQNDNPGLAESLELNFERFRIEEFNNVADLIPNKFEEEYIAARSMETKYAIRAQMILNRIDDLEKQMAEKFRNEGSSGLH